MRFFLLFILAFSSLSAKPVEDIPIDLWDAYTLDGQIPVSYWYFDNTYSSNQPIIFSKRKIDNLVLKAKRRENSYYGLLDSYLYSAIENNIGDFEGKTVGILGSVTPWYEAIILAYGGRPVTVEYNKIISEHPLVNVMTVEEYKDNPIQFDYLLSISSIEHDGLGRYGDPINPFGDIETMNDCRNMLKDDGVFILAIPIGPDQIVWNAHRIYGKKRLPMLLDKWEVVDSVGYSEEDFNRKLNNWQHQPVFVLKKK